jgi:ABC-type bacteriocin/lantibiotic exporter with double-glycine peptidase domain
MRDIVAAALTMHVIALSVPIFFQLLVDKVVPNQAFSTLYALSAGRRRADPSMLFSITCATTFSPL